MEYLIGVALAVAVAIFAALVGFDRERAFYATVLIVVASYYVLFAAMGAPGKTVMVETGCAFAFVLLAGFGYRKNAWLVAAALIGHGLFDSVHHLFIVNPGVPRWWPGFCLAFDALFGVLMAVRLRWNPPWVART